MAALAASPFDAAGKWRLIANSNLDVFLVRPRFPVSRLGAEEAVHDVPDLTITTLKTSDFRLNP
jgi:hypothetical protein